MLFILLITEYMGDLDIQPIFGLVSNVSVYNKTNAALDSF